MHVEDQYSQGATVKRKMHFQGTAQRDGSG